jgi:prepilin-type N-terminal cleavage/methylation domain-containing protein
MKSQRSVKSQGFTLIELLVVIGVIAILAAIVLVAVNPGRQFAQARDTQRRSDLYSVTNAIYQFAAEHEGKLPDTNANPNINSFPTVPTCIGAVAPCFNLGTAGDADKAGVGNPPTEPVVPTYIAAMPTDPSTGTPADTQYTVFVGTDGRVVASASGELVPSIRVQR